MKLLAQAWVIRRLVYILVVTRVHMITSLAELEEALREQQLDVDWSVQKHGCPERWRGICWRNESHRKLR